MSVFMKASAFALKEQPVVNAVIDGKEIVYRDYVDISVAVATPSGLMVPVIKNVEKKGFAEIEKVKKLFFLIKRILLIWLIKENKEK